jgi:hypothetical protein
MVAFCPAQICGGFAIALIGWGVKNVNVIVLLATEER